MSKKLVKTAKQQFEERQEELTLLTSYQGVKDEKLYLCENDHKEMSILIDSKECGFIEYKYQGGYQSMIDSEDFLYNMVCRFNEISEPVKHIFDWYASADKDLTPFTVYDIWKCMEYLTQEVFEGLYEEVPDVRIITAKEQWEKDSEGAEVVQKLGNGSEYRVAVTDGSITFFVYQDGGDYFREVYPSFEELRKDVNFVMAYLSHVRATHDKDVDYALAWLQGGEYTMSKVSLLDIYEVGKCIDHLSYEDKEEPAEKTDNRTVMNMYDPFNWLRSEGCGTWEWISEFCNNENEYGRLDVLYSIIEGTLKAEDEFSNPPTMEEIKADYEQSFPLMLAGVFENLAKDIRKGELKFKMDYRKM